MMSSMNSLNVIDIHDNSINLSNSILKPVGSLRNYERDIS